MAERTAGLAPPEFGHAQVPIARHRGDHRQTVNRDAVEAAVVDLPGQHRLLADGFRFAVHDAAAGNTSARSALRHTSP
jgi:hypothetical protein